MVCFKNLFPKKSLFRYRIQQIWDGSCWVYIVSDYVLLINITGKRKFMPNEYKIRVAKEHALRSIFYFPYELRSIVYIKSCIFNTYVTVYCINENYHYRSFYVKGELDWKHIITTFLLICCVYTYVRNFLPGQYQHSHAYVQIIVLYSVCHVHGGRAIIKMFYELSQNQFLMNDNFSNNIEFLINLKLHEMLPYVLV